MEFDIAVVLFIIFMVYVLPWLLLLRARHRSNKAQKEFESRFVELSTRICALENAVKDLRAESKAASAVAEGVTAKVEAPKPAVERPAAVVAPPPMISRFTPPPTSHEIDATAPQDIAAQIKVFKTDKPTASTVTEGAANSSATNSYAVAKPSTAQEESVSAFAALDDTPGLFHAGYPKSTAAFEETLGTNWLNKIGIVIIVFGISFFLAWQLRELGPAGKVLTGFVVSGALLGAGLFLEKRPGYSMLARAGIGGGWALTFFTTYAMYHVDAARVLSSQGADLVLMGLVAAGMVAHSLRYRSQTVTGLAFLLAFSTVTISHVTVYSLAAGVVLSIALVVIVLRMRWYEIEVFGLLAAYLNHLHWLWGIIEPMQGHKHAFAECVPSAVILVLYWLIFRISYIVRKVENSTQENIATAAALLNTVCLLGIFKYQSLHPEWTFWALLVLGSAELGLSFAARRRRRIAFLVLSIIGVTLLFAAVPFRYGDMNLSILWAAAAEALLFVGIVVRERVFRRLGFAACIVTIVQMLALDVAYVTGIRSDDAMPGRILTLGFVLLVTAAVFYGNWIFISRRCSYPRWCDLFDDIDSDVLRLITYGSLLLAAAGLWVVFPGTETAPAWALAALLLGAIYSRQQLFDLKLQADALVASAFLRAVFDNLQNTAKWGTLSQRLLTVVLCAAALYSASCIKTQHERYERYRIPAIYGWLASTLVFLVLWYELHSVGVATAWALLGLLLIEAGRHSLALRMQGYVALLSSFIRIFTANLAAGGAPGELSPRLYSVVPIIAIYVYMYLRLSRKDLVDELPESRFHVAEFCGWAGFAAFAALVRFELQPDWVVVAWAALVFVLLAAAWRTGRLLFMHQALLLTLFTSFRGAAHNLYERSFAAAPFFYSRAFCVSAACVLLFASLAIAYKLAGRQPATESTSILKRSVSSSLRHPEQILFFAPWLLVISLLGAEMSRGLLTVSWSVFGVLTFLVALWIGERSFRLAGLGLLLLGVCKIIVVDMWSLGERDRCLTFICMGAALLLVSFLYTKYREAIRQYL